MKVTRPGRWHAAKRAKPQCVFTHSSCAAGRAKPQQRRSMCDAVKATTSFSPREHAQRNAWRRQAHRSDHVRRACHDKDRAAKRDSHAEQQQGRPRSMPERACACRGSHARGAGQRWAFWCAKPIDVAMLRSRAPCAADVAGGVGQKASSCSRGTEPQATKARYETVNSLAASSRQPAGRCLAFSNFDAGVMSKALRKRLSSMCARYAFISAREGSAR